VRSVLSVAIHASGPHLPYEHAVGLYGDSQDDLSRHRVHYTYSSSGPGLFDAAGANDVVIGTARLGLGLDFGGTHDVF
jgi:hypothetical protein